MYYKKMYRTLNIFLLFFFQLNVVAPLYKYLLYNFGILNRIQHFDLYYFYILIISTNL